MIANSQPYNPNASHAKPLLSNGAQTGARRASPACAQVMPTSQQNSVYGQATPRAANQANATHLLDLPNSASSSAATATSAFAAAAVADEQLAAQISDESSGHLAAVHLDQHQQQHQRLRSSKRNMQAQQQQQQALRSNNTSTDMSLYSPSSSSASLLYHIYDRIDLPSGPPQNECLPHQTPHQTADQQRPPASQVPKSATTHTILNPANLFGGAQSQSQSQSQSQQQQPTYLFGHAAASYVASEANPYESRQQLMIDSMLRYQTQTLANARQQQHQFAQSAANQHRHQTSGAPSHRPLSSSGVSSLSNQSTSTQSPHNLQLAYGRHARNQQNATGKLLHHYQQQQHHSGPLFAQPLNPIALMGSTSTSSSSAATLANGFVSHRTSNDFASGAQNNASSPMGPPTPPSDQSTCYMQHQLTSRLSLTNLHGSAQKGAAPRSYLNANAKDPFIRAAAAATTTTTTGSAGLVVRSATGHQTASSNGSSPTANRWKQVPQLTSDWHKVFQMSPNNKRAARTLFSEHKYLIQWSILLLVLALSLVSILKFISAPQQATSSNTLANNNNRMRK